MWSSDVNGRSTFSVSHDHVAMSPLCASIWRRDAALARASVPADPRNAVSSRRGPLFFRRVGASSPPDPLSLPERGDVLQRFGCLERNDGAIVRGTGWIRWQTVGILGQTVGAQHAAPLR